jgi:preprotein translocase subunit SecA
MLKSLTRIFGGDPIRRQLESYSEAVARINALEKDMKTLSDEALQAKTDEFRSRLADGETLDDLLAEAFAVVREVSVRTVGLRHYDVQLIGGIVLHEGKIAEMKTGEGKTLVATLPIYLNALTGKGVHLITVNDYLARRDARWMGPIFDFLGLSVGVLQTASRSEGGRKALMYAPGKESSQEDVHQLELVDRKLAYTADVTYGTNNEFGFDYLRDNMARTLEARSQRGHHYAILDEVDNILIDEARTPLIISGPAQEDPEMYIQMAAVVKQMNAEDYEINERDRSISLTELGEDHAEKIMGRTLRDPDRPEDITPEQARLLGHLQQALRAEHLFKRNKEYVVQGGRVIIVDSFTGRLMPGRRWSDGLHQAVEAKEGVRVRQENVTYATITLQNYFRKYEKLSGMTGTALTEAEEFNEIYNVDVVPLPMNLEYRAEQPKSDLVEVEYRENGYQFSYYAATDDEDETPEFWRRKDYPDVVYRTEEAKLRSVTSEILRRCTLGQPLLVGTTSVELSELLSKRLRSEPLQRAAMISILRQVYMEANDIPAEGMRIAELEPLNKPLDELRPSDLRSFARDLDLNLNPTRPENLERLARILDLDSSHHEHLTELLRSGISHNVLNAKKHTEESQIIEGAGAKGAVTIATNMAGRGVDIVLGGSLPDEAAQRVTRVARDSYERAGRMQEREEMAHLLRAGSGSGYGKASHIQRLERWRREFADLDHSEMGIYEADVEAFDRFISDREHVLKAGGLHVLGCVRHEARRIDNQLRGRAARQGDPGSSQFFLSLEDDLMRLFGGSQVSNLMQRLNIDDAMPIAHNIVNRVIEQSQGRVEGANFDVRKHLLEYDDVLNQQREVFYSQRDRVFTKGDLSEDINEMLRFEVERHVEASFEDEDGDWKLLAWMEEIQPSLNVDAVDAYPSYMLRLILDDLGDNEDGESLFQSLVEVARQALNTQNEHVRRAVVQQIDRTLERLDDQVDQRVEMAEMAIEGALLEAEETGEDVNPSTLVQAVERATGVRIKMESDALNQIRENPDKFRKLVPQLIEGGLGIRVWTGLVQSAERRIGEPLNMEYPITTPIDWDEAGQQLLAAVDRIGSSKTERLLGDVERDLRSALERVKKVDEALILRLLVRMSYGRQAYFDKKTHQRKSALVARLTYPFYAARYLDSRGSEELTDEIMSHLEGARRALTSSLGQGELTRLAHTKLEDYDEAIRESMLRELNHDIYEKLANGQSIASLDESFQAQIAAVLGSRLLTESYRRLILSVGDRLWIDYLTQMEALRTSIGLEAYAQRDPLVQYKSRAFDMFAELLATMRAGVITRMFRVRTAAPAQAAPGRSTSGSRSTKKKRRRRHR